MSSRPPQIIGDANSSNLTCTGNPISEGEDQGREFLQWLSPLEPKKQHQDVRKDRLNSVGNWVLETSEFRKWRDGKDGCVGEQVLFCYGDPGVGKTYVSSLVIDSLCDKAVGKDVAVVGLYCDFLAQQEHTSANMLGAMLKQLATRGGISKHMREGFRKAKKEFGGRGLQLPETVGILKKTISSLSRLFICIDALDECTPKDRWELIESLREIVQVLPGARVFLTGRPHISDEIVTCFSKAIRMPLSSTHGDIKSYLEMRLDSDTDPKAMDAELRADIMRIIPEKVSEIFHLVTLSMDSILGEISLSQRRKKLDEMIQGEVLGHAYAQTLSRIQAQPESRSKLGMEVLMWVSHAERPLLVDELCHALGVEASTDLDIRNIPAIETLQACTMGLIIVEKSTSTVRLVHHTLREYLSNNINLFPNAHSILAEVCLTYLNFPHLRGISSATGSVPPTAPFVQYASCYWGKHARLETTESVETLALDLLDGYDKHISSKVLLLPRMRAEELPIGGDGASTGFTGLHCAAYFGCVELIVALLKTNKGDVQATDYRGKTAFDWAWRRGHKGAVRALLERSDVNSDTHGTEYGSRLLLWGAENGHERVVRILLERKDINPNKADKQLRTPLLLASERGHERVVRMLLERKDITPDKSDMWRRRPLLLASVNGCEGAVRMLLERKDINPNKSDEQRQTPLSGASGRGHEGIVRMLLERKDTNPNKTCGLGQTPLSLASSSGRERVVRILLERKDINPDKPDTQGRTPLSLASRSGRTGIVRMLLERKDINPNKSDKQYQTPLSLASAQGHEGVVMMLLDRKGINPNKSDNWRQTPLSIASAKGHEGVVRMLLEQKDITRDKPDDLGRTPLILSSERGHERVVRMLLERKDITPEKSDKKDQTPLFLASAKGHEGIVRMLLERQDITPDKSDNLGRTPLLIASTNGSVGVVRILLERKDVSPDKSDEQGQTPLSLASKHGYEGIVKMLLERKDINPDKPDTLGQTPLSLASGSGHTGVVRMLLERKDINPNKSDKWHQTPLSLASAQGHEGVVGMLLERKDINPDKQDNLGRTPLSLAYGKKREGVVRILLEWNNANSDKIDRRS